VNLLYNKFEYYHGTTQVMEWMRQNNCKSCFLHKRNLNYWIVKLSSRWGGWGGKLEDNRDLARLSSWLSADERLLYGHYDLLMYELRMEDQASFFNFLRMHPEMFDKLLARIAPRIQKQDTRYRKALEPGFKLAVTIRFLHFFEVIARHFPRVFWWHSSDSCRI